MLFSFNDFKPNALNCHFFTNDFSSLSFSLTSPNTSRWHGAWAQKHDQIFFFGSLENKNWVSRARFRFQIIHYFGFLPSQTSLRLNFYGLRLEWYIFREPYGDSSEMLARHQFVCIQSWRKHEWICFTFSRKMVVSSGSSLNFFSPNAFAIIRYPPRKKLWQAEINYSVKYCIDWSCQGSSNPHPKPASFSSIGQTKVKYLSQTNFARKLIYNRLGWYRGNNSYYITTSIGILHDDHG